MRPLGKYPKDDDTRPFWFIMCVVAIAFLMGILSTYI